MNEPVQATRPVRILLVDDDKGDILLTTKALQSNQLLNHIDVVNSGEEALQFLRQQGQFADAKRPDLVLMDINMPGMTGIETLAEIKKEDAIKNIPVVMLTTSRSDTDILMSYELQASCFVTKPVDLQELTKVVAAINDFWLCVVKYPPQD